MPDLISKVEKNRNSGRKKGTPKTGGREKGTPNKRTADIIERLKGVDIVGELLEIAKTTEKDETKVTIYKELMKYIYPQRKAIDIDTEKNTGLTIVVADEKTKKMIEDL